ncbi:hypothetical protein ACFQJC_02750 [Haloferax namakaokahaiae]|uniref:Uncharacterized protein n=1 Tax=Haloferax namakaokahaiae TaxID=1748331 RepID=A0ABD5ZBK7_9EURY
MRYESVLVALTPTAVRDRIRKRVEGIRSSKVEDGFEFRTNSGLLVGTVSPATLPDGSTGSRLRYRTSILSATAAHAGRTGKELREAVSKNLVRD